MTHDEIVATAMLLGEFPPVTCSGCRGTGYYTSTFLGPRRCLQCEGTGYDAIGTKTLEALKNEQNAT